MLTPICFSFLLHQTGEQLSGHLGLLQGLTEEEPGRASLVKGHLLLCARRVSGTERVSRCFAWTWTVRSWLSRKVGVTKGRHINVRWKGKLQGISRLQLIP